MVKIKIKRSTLKHIRTALIGLIILGAVILTIVLLFRSCSSDERKAERRELGETPEERYEPKLMYGIDYEDYRLVTEKVKTGQTLSHILGGLGVSGAMIDKIDRTAKPVFNMRSIRAGQPYTAFMENSGNGETLRHFIYEKNVTDYVVVSIIGDSVAVHADSKEVTINRRKETARIKSSLWNSMVENDLPVAISCDLEDIYGWSIDFFGLQPGDEFTVIFDERYIDTVRVGVGRVWGAEFKHGGKTYYAIPFKQGNKIEYWDENGNSLRKQLLKAPLKYSRISSTFSNARMHPILKVRRPHHGVDYAAPAGTPVVAIADGTVVTKGWDNGGGGNILKIKHANNLTSGYLHLKGYAKGIAVGKRVSQGEVIAYVGSTGRSTGPHLDFRLWKGGTAIDPLKAPSEPSEPISAANRENFRFIMNMVMAELEGDVPDGRKVTLEKLNDPTPTAYDDRDTVNNVPATEIPINGIDADAPVEKMSKREQRKAARRAAREAKNSAEQQEPEDTETP